VTGTPPAPPATLATATTSVYRYSGLFARLPPTDEAEELLAAARELAGEDPAAQAAVALAECGALADAFISELAEPEMTATETTVIAERAVELARRVGDPLAESAALDALTGAQLLAGDPFATAATSRRRIDLLSQMPLTPSSATEVIDTLVMVTDTAISVGDLQGARRWGTQLRDLPVLAEVGHFATSRPLVADALAGNVEDVLTGSRWFLDAWERSGRLRASSLGVAAAVAMIHGLRSDEDTRAEWLAVFDELGVPRERSAGYGPTFNAIVLLHHGEAEAAMDALAAEPDELGKWVTWMWRHWYAALRAEATVLAGHPDASGRLAAARTVVAGNPVAGAIIDRAEALLGGHRNRLLATVAAFDSAGSRYQWARTLRFAGGGEAATGAAALADLGVAPMRRDRLIKRRASPGACPLPRQPAGRRPARSTGGELGDRPLDLRWALGRRSAAC
jgi:hypothetical protein